MSYIDNEVAYERARIANIQNNRRICARPKIIEEESE